MHAIAICTGRFVHVRVKRYFRACDRACWAQAFAFRAQATATMWSCSKCPTSTQRYSPCFWSRAAAFSYESKDSRKCHLHGSWAPMRSCGLSICRAHRDARVIALCLLFACDCIVGVAPRRVFASQVCQRPCRCVSDRVAFCNHSLGAVSGISCQHSLTSNLQDDCLAKVRSHLLKEHPALDHDEIEELLTVANRLIKFDAAAPLT